VVLAVPENRAGQDLRNAIIRSDFEGPEAGTEILKK
jgi:hypothetical protein